MSKLNEKTAKRFGLEGDWDEVIFTAHNPTNSDVLFDLFSPLVVLQNNVPNTPFGYVQPPVVEGVYSPIPTPIPVVPNYPLLNAIDNYPVISNDNTMIYDSVHNRMYMTYVDSTVIPNKWYLTWKDAVNPFMTTSLLMATGSPINVVDTAISTTSNKLFVLTASGQILIYNTNTNTYIGFVTIPSLGVLVCDRIEWNSVKNTLYISVFSTDDIWEMDATTHLFVAIIVNPAGSKPFALAFKASTNEMFVTYEGTSAIAKIDCTLNTVSTIIGASITANPTTIFYNPNNDLVTYGSQLNVGVRTFNATTLVFLPAVIALAILDIELYYPDDKLYLLESGVNNVVVADSNTLAVVDNVATTVNSGTRAEIAFYVPDDQLYYNVFTGTKVKVGRISRGNLKFWIDGSAGYNFSVRDFFTNPCWVRRIYIFSKDENNFKQVINHLYKDANGHEFQIPLIPSLSVGINQFQGWIAELDFPNNEVVFGINQWFKDVLIEKRSELTMLLIYKQIDKSAMISSVGLKTAWDETSKYNNTLRKWSERDLALYDTAKISPYKQNMYLGQTQDVVRPFDFSLLKMWQDK